MKKTIIFVILLVASIITTAQLNVDIGLNTSIGKIDFYESNYSLCLMTTAGISYTDNNFGIQTAINYGSVPLIYSKTGIANSVNAKIRTLSLSIIPQLNVKDFYIGTGVVLYKPLKIAPENMYKSLENQLSNFVYAYQLSLGYQKNCFKTAIFYERSMNKYFVMSSTKHSIIGVKGIISINVLKKNPPVKMRLDFTLRHEK